MTKHEAELLLELRKWFADYTQESSSAPHPQASGTDGASSTASVDISPITRSKGTFRASFKRVKNN